MDAMPICLRCRRAATDKTSVHAGFAGVDKWRSSYKDERRPKLQRKECVLMASDEKDDTTPYVVLMNIEEQYSLMPKSIAVPNGWKVVKEGTRTEWGASVNEVWTDNR